MLLGGVEDAGWVYPDPGNMGAVALGSALPGFGFGFIQLPADINGVTVNGQRVQAVTVAACGDRYHIAGFAVLPPYGYVQFQP